MALLALLLAAAGPAHAYDPALAWYTVETPHFRVHYHEGLGAMAQRAARALEAAHKRLAPLMERAPERRVEVVLSDETDGANGSATVWMRTEMHLYAVPPDSRSELNDYEDYLWNLVVHEYTHVLQLGDIGGVPWIVNRVFGDLWIPNGIEPRWFTEGLAVRQESAASGGGRERASVYDMYLRSEVLEGRFYGIDDAGGSPTTWPRGGIAYLHGARFLDWIAQTYGAQALTAYHHDYGSQVIPFAINYTARDHLGETWTDLYDQWEKEVSAQIEGQASAIRHRGERSPTRLTFRGEGTGEPVFLDPDRVLYLEDSADRRAALRSVWVNGKADRKLGEVYGGGTLAIAPDRCFAVVSQTNVHAQFYWYEDLFRYDLNTGSLEQLTHGARLTEPDVSPDGKTLVAARRLAGGRMALATLPSSSGAPITSIYEAPVATSVYTPRFSPDGKKVAFSEQRPSGRDIRLLDLATGQIADVTRDRALDLDPAFSPDGKTLYFVSDRTGVFNVYARDLESGKTWQVTNVLTGAFRPAVSPDGRRLAVVTYSTVGFDVAVMDLDRERFLDAPEVDLVRPAPPDWEGREAYPARPYQPLDTLRPYYWLPMLGADAMGPTLGITTSGADVVGKHSWALDVQLGLASLQPSFSAAYSTQLYYPDLTIQVGSELGTVSNAPKRQYERQYHGAASLTFPFTRLDQSYSVGLGYELRYYDPWAVEAPHDPTGELPFKADKGLAATLSLSLGFSNTQRFANSISAERGVSARLNLRGGRPEWGSQFEYYSAEGAIATYLAMPWLEHHVLALRLMGGASYGGVGGRRVFSLGGLSVHDPILDLLQLAGLNGAGLRGYRPGAFSGSYYTLFNAEYRFPIVRVDAGLWTLPIYVRRIHAAVTFDVGEATDTWTWRGLRPSVGAELRAELYLGYALSTTLRLGYAHGLAPEGVDDFFFGLGNSF
ncbi:MAG: BamA/TamA family outer membrane protein [Myxococcales bacterium]